MTPAPPPLYRAGTTTPGGSAPFASAPSDEQRGRRAPAAFVRASLRVCTVEGTVAEVVTSCAGGAVLTGWALYLGCGPLLVGVIVALPQMAQLLQLPGAWTTSFLGHRRACLWLIGLSRQALLPLVALPFLPIGEGAKQWVLVAIAAVSAVLGVMGNNAWQAWMGELVPRAIRGRYFGRRTAICMLGGGLASAAAGAFLDRAGAGGETAFALAALALVACVAGGVTSLLLHRMFDPSPNEAAAAVDLKAALAPFEDRGYRGILGYQLAWNFAVGLASSFFALHMLKNLGMGFALIALHGTAVAAVRMVATPLWGRAIDRVGARPVLLACSFGVTIIPLPWLFATPDFLWPIALDALLSGILWGGHGVAAFALPLAVAPRKGRPFYLAAFAMAGGLAFAAATATGGLLAQALPESFELGGRTFANLHVLFVLTSVARFGAAFHGVRISERGARGLPDLARLARGYVGTFVAPVRAHFSALAAGRD